MTRDQTLAKPVVADKKGLLLKASCLWSWVVALALARCVFYCFLIIARRLPGRIYWRRQAAQLLNAYGADTSCASAAAAVSKISAGLCGGWPSCCKHVRKTGGLAFLKVVCQLCVFTSLDLICGAEINLSGPHCTQMQSGVLDYLFVIFNPMICGNFSNPQQGYPLLKPANLHCIIRTNFWGRSG